MNENLRKSFERNIQISGGIIDVWDFLKDVKKGDIIMIDNSSRGGTFEPAASVGKVLKVCDNFEEIYVQTGFYGFALGEIGIPVKFTDGKSRRFYPERLVYGAVSALGETAYHNSKLFRGKKEIDAQLRKYNSSFEAFEESLKKL